MVCVLFALLAVASSGIVTSRAVVKSPVFTIGQTPQYTFSGQLLQDSSLSYPLYSQPLYSSYPNYQNIFSNPSVISYPGAISPIAGYPSYPSYPGYPIIQNPVAGFPSYPIAPVQPPALSPTPVDVGAPGVSVDDDTVSVEAAH